MKTTSKISAIVGSMGLVFGLGLGLSVFATSAHADETFAGPVMMQTQTKNQFDYSSANQYQNQLKQQNKNGAGENKQQKQYKKQYQKGKSH